MAIHAYIRELIAIAEHELDREKPTPETLERLQKLEELDILPENLRYEVLELIGIYEEVLS